MTTPHSPLPLPTRFLLLVCAALAAQLANQPAVAQQQTRQLIERRESELPAWAQDNLRRIDAEVDGWRTEVLHGAAQAPLKELVAWLGDASQQLDQSQLLHTDFQLLTALRPEAFETVYDDGATVVRQASDLSNSAAATSLAKWAASHQAAVRGEHPHPFAKFVDVSVNGDRMYADVLVHWSNYGTEGAVQVNTKWRTEWQIGASDEELKLRGIAVRFYEEIQSEHLLFEEITESVFGGLAFYNDEILTGVGDYNAKQDRLISQSFIGSQGMSLGDVNGDGLDDLYLCNQGGVPNRLLVRTPRGTVRDITEQSGLGFLETTRSALFIDLDDDGDQDFAGAVGANVLIAYNNGKGRFGSPTPLRGPGAAEIYSLSAADPDNDGDLDIYACRYVRAGILGGVPTPYHDATNGATNIYWRNEGDGNFVDATEQAGFAANNTKYSLASIWEDLDADGDLDLYVANDFGKNNYWLNEGGKFRDVAVERGAEDQAAGMGVSTADYDGDGDLDILVTNMFSSAGLRIAPQQQFQGENHELLRDDYIRHARGNTLLQNQGDGTFVDVTEDAGVAIAGWSWGSKFVDFNNDGFADIYSPNGFLTGPVKDDL